MNIHAVTVACASCAGDFLTHVADEKTASQQAHNRHNWGSSSPKILGEGGALPHQPLHHQVQN